MIVPPSPVIVHQDEPRPRGVELAELATEPLVIAAGLTASPERDALHLRFLHQRPFVAFATDMNLRATVDRALEQHDVRPRIVLESNEPLTVRNLAAAGLGYAWSRSGSPTPPARL